MFLSYLDFFLQWCLRRREQLAPRHRLSWHLWPQVYRLQPGSTAETQQTLLIGIPIATDALGIWGRGQLIREMGSLSHGETNLHGKNRQQTHCPNRAQTSHLLHPSQSPRHHYAASRYKINQNRWLNCQISHQRELWQYNKKPLNWQRKNKIECCRYRDINSSKTSSLFLCANPSKHVDNSRTAIPTHHL